MPVTSGTYQRPDLRIPTSEWDQQADREKMIALKVLPAFEAGLQSANYPKIPKEHLIPKNDDLVRAPRGNFKRDTFKFDQDSYAVKQHGFEELLDDFERATYAYAIDAEMYQSLRAALRVLREMEVNCATALQSTATFANAAVGTAWTTIATADPVADIHAAVKAVRSNSGQIANTVVLGWAAFLQLQTVDSIIDRLKYWGGDDPKKITRQALAALFEVEEVLVAQPQVNTADEGQAASLGECWDPGKVFVGRVGKTNDLREVCVGRTFHFSGDGSDVAVAFEQYRDEAKKSDVMRAFCNYDQKIIYPECGYVITGTNVT